MGQGASFSSVEGNTGCLSPSPMMGESDDQGEDSDKYRPRPLKWIESEVKEKRFASRSHAIEYAVNELKKRS